MSWKAWDACRRRICGSYRYPVVFLACCPKSGSTWFANTLAKIIPGYRYFHPEAIRRPDGGTTDMTPAVLAEFRGRHGVARAHTRATPENLLALEASFGRWLFLSRDMRDVVVSIYHHLHRYPQSSFLETDAVRHHPWTPLPRSALQLSQGACLDLIIERMLPDLGDFMRGWLQAMETRDHILHLRYEDLTRDTVRSADRALAFFDISVRSARVRRVVARYDRSRLPVGKWKFRQGRSGVGQHELSTSQQRQIEALCGDFQEPLGYAA